VGIEVRRAGERFVTTAPGRATYHSFSFGEHYDPANIGFGLLVAHNDDTVEPGFGYDDHPHRDTEIVTWVLSGALTHRDSDGRSGTVRPGTVQVMSAGSGIVHAETVEPGAGSTRFVQTWVRPDQPGGVPRYDAAPVPLGAEWVPVASGSHPASATRIDAGRATLWVAAPEAGTRLALPEAAYTHLFIATGAVGFDDESLSEADAARLTDVSGELVATESSQLLVWTFA
jgi:redox-sensitive bicupin YhaK (pirin superfamily)